MSLIDDVNSHSLWTNQRSRMGSHIPGPDLELYERRIKRWHFPEEGELQLEVQVRKLLVISRLYVSGPLQFHVTIPQEKQIFEKMASSRFPKERHSWSLQDLKYRRWSIPVSRRFGEFSHCIPGHLGFKGIYLHVHIARNTVLLLIILIHFLHGILHLQMRL